jgi:hypothetical protein
VASGGWLTPCEHHSDDVRDGVGHTDRGDDSFALLPFTSLARILHEGFDVGSVVEMVGGGASWGRRG